MRDETVRLAKRFNPALVFQMCDNRHQIFLLGCTHIPVIQIECQSARVGRCRSAGGVRVGYGEFLLVLHRPHQRRDWQRSVEPLFVVVSDLSEQIARLRTNEAEKTNLQTAPGVRIVQIISLALEITGQIGEHLIFSHQRLAPRWIRAESRQQFALCLRRRERTRIMPPSAASRRSRRLTCLGQR